MAENGDKEQISDLETKICQQIEYYFGDHNLPRDKFLKEQITLDDGWVSLETMIKFNRLSKLTTDFKIIINALKKSKSELLEINEEKCKIRRSAERPLPEATEEYKNAIKNRSVYVKGFPTDTSLDDVKTWLETGVSIENIQMRRTLQKVFKGSIFVVFDTEESAKAFLENKNRKFKDSDMIIMTKEEYFTKKNDERKQNKSEAKAKSKHDKEEAQKQAEDAEMVCICRKFKGKGRGRGNESSPKKKIQFQGKKKKFESSDEEDSGSPQKETGKTNDAKNEQNGAGAPGSPKKRALEEKPDEEPASKQAKTEA
ncbi:lupus La protein [Bombina bombina]|uniref:lupus La protein n=1 Tax=Bombina bombina TaxID=8345 RepID=UPI00235A8B01|nr:lupus La protein [Bombina bombina]